MILTFIIGFRLITINYTKKRINSQFSFILENFIKNENYFYVLGKFQMWAAVNLFMNE